MEVRHALWRNDFVDKKQAQEKAKLVAYLTYARVSLISQQLLFSTKAFAKLEESYERAQYRYYWRK